MKTYAVLAFAVLIAVAAADFDYLAGIRQALTDTDCTVQTPGYVVNLSSVPLFNSTVDITESGIGTMTYKVALSACTAINISGCPSATYVYVQHGTYEACYSTAPTYTFNSTSNVTTATYAPPTTVKRSVLLDADTPYALTVEYKCSVILQPDLVSMGGSIDGSTMDLTFSTDAACASVPTPAPTPAPPVATPAPDDKKGLSSWAIVLIVVAAVIAVVFVAVCCWKCRGSKKEDADGVYNQVA